MADNEASLLIKIKQTGGEVLDHLVVTLGDVFEAVKKVGEFLWSFAEAYNKQEKAVNSLNQAMVQQGMYTSELAQGYREQAEALSKVTTFSETQVTSAQALLQGFIGQHKVTTELTKATLDLATAKKIDLSSAAELVGKAISTTTNRLAAYGVKVDETADRQTKMIQVVEGLNKVVGGQADAAAKGLGSVEQFKNVWEEFQEKVGGRLAPVITLIVKALTELMDTVSGNSDGLNIFIALIQGISQQAIMVARDFDVMGKIIGNVLGGIATTIQDLIGGQWKAAWNDAKSIVSVSGDDIAKSNEVMNDRLKALNDAFNQGFDVNLKEREDLQKDSDARRNQVAAEEAAQSFLARDIRDQELNAYEAQLNLAKLQDMGQFHTTELAAKEAHLTKLAALETNSIKKADIIRQKDAVTKQQQEEAQAQAKLKLQTDTFATIATLAHSNNQALALIGKAAGITQIAIDTPIAISKALAAFPPPFSFVAAGLVAAAMAAQAANIAGVQLAEGGIVPATPGGVQATIGEGGSAEAVIPLDSEQGRSMLGGGQGGVTVNLNGVMMIDDSQAYKIAKIVDEQLLVLRQKNESKSFDTYVT